TLEEIVAERPAGEIALVDGGSEGEDDLERRQDRVDVLHVERAREDCDTGLASYMLGIGNRGDQIGRYATCLVYGGQAGRDDRIMVAVANSGRKGKQIGRHVAGIAEQRIVEAIVE